MTGQAKSLPALAQGKKATVVMFISTRCPISNAYNERMTTLAKKYSALGVSFVGIDSDQNEPKAEVASFTKDKGFPFPVLVDPGNKVSDAYSAHVTPETYVINSKGVLVYHGRIDNDMDTFPMPRRTSWPMHWMRPWRASPSRRRRRRRSAARSNGDKMQRTHRPRCADTPGVTAPDPETRRGRGKHAGQRQGQPIRNSSPPVSGGVANS